MTQGDPFVTICLPWQPSLSTQNRKTLVISHSCGILTMLPLLEALLTFIIGRTKNNYLWFSISLFSQYLKNLADNEAPPEIKSKRHLWQQKCQCVRPLMVGHTWDLHSALINI